MCGIGGQFVYGDAQTIRNVEPLARLSKRLASRGPDGEGLYLSKNRRVGLVHRRLAIIDLSEAGAQPMVDDETGLIIVYNGEIYNYRELRSNLISKGYRFKSNSDTEVLIKLYDYHGADMVSQLRGMFAFAIWDKKNNGMFLARDALGIKPLYIADDGKTFRFASQVKALLATGEIDNSFDAAGQVGFFLWGHTPEPFTLYKSIKSLPAGSTLWVESGGSKKRQQFFDLRNRIETLEPISTVHSAADARQVLAEALRESIHCHTVSDVPVGVFLSSGLDSCTIMALLREVQGGQLTALTLGFDEFRGSNLDEVPLAKVAADSTGADIKTGWVSRQDFSNSYEHLLDSMDQPTIDGVNTYFVCKAAKEAGIKVAMSGVGGDEILAGYSDFTEIHRSVYALALVSRVPALGKTLRQISAPLLKRFTSPKYASLFEYGGTYEGAYLLRRALFLPWELENLLDAKTVSGGLQELSTEAELGKCIPKGPHPRLKVSSLLSSWYMRNQLLRDADWASMAHSIELRTPLIDTRLWETVMRLNISGWPVSKLDLARSPKKPLPDAVLNRRKTGFSIPVRDWLIAEKPESKEAHVRGLRPWSTRIFQHFASSDSRAS